jgi:hypothetical protein
MPVTTAKAILTVANIPAIWRFRMMLHGVRLSRLAYDDLTTAGCEAHVTYRVTMAHGHLVGAESAPLEVRVNLRAASFVLSAFEQQSAEIRADSGGALLAILHVASPAHECDEAAREASTHHARCSS